MGFGVGVMELVCGSIHYLLKQCFYHFALLQMLDSGAKIAQVECNTKQTTVKPAFILNCKVAIYYMHHLYCKR